MISKIINEELNRIKNLFDYQRGRVVSEQKFLLKEDGSENMNDYPACVRVFGAPRETSQYSGFWRIFGTDNWIGYQFSSGGQNPAVKTPSGNDNYYCDRYGKLQIGKNYGAEYDAREAQNNELEKAKVQSQNATIAKQQPKKTTTTTQKPAQQKPKYVKPKEIDNIKDFQDWLDDHHSDEQEGAGKGWATGFPEGKLSGGKGYGTYGPRSNKAWEKYGNEYGKLKSLPIAPVELKQVVTSPVQPPTELKPMQQINTQNIIQANQQAVTPENIYKILYDGGMVQGEPGSNDRIRIKVSSLDDTQKEKLKQYMPSLGYEYLRTKNDGRLVFRKTETGEKEQQDEV